MGIHNEAGTSKHELTTVAELVDQMLGKITDTKDKERAFVPFGHDGLDEVVLMVNDLGAVSQLELGGIASEGESCSTFPAIGRSVRARKGWCSHVSYPWRSRARSRILLWAAPFDVRAPACSRGNTILNSNPYRLLVKIQS